MKKNLHLLFFIIIFLFIGCKPSPQKAEDYYLKIEKQLYVVINKEAVLIDFINIERDKSDSIQKLNNSDSFSSKVEIAFIELKNKVENSLTAVEKMESFGNNSKLLDAAIGVLKAYQDVVNNEYASIIKISKIPLSLYTEEDDSKFLELNETVDTKLQKKIDEYIVVVKDFSREYNFEILSDSLAVNIKENE